MTNIKDQFKNNSLAVFIFIFIISLLISYILPIGSLFQGHGSFLTPHYLAVSSNLLETKYVLCNSLENGICIDSYHRHPPLYFYINALFALAANDNGEYYIELARTFSIFFNLLSIYFLYKIFKSIYVIIIPISMIGFWFYSTLSSFDSLTLLLISIMWYSYNRNDLKIQMFVILLSTLTSWYMILFSFIFILIVFLKDKKINISLLLSFLIGVVIVILFIVLGNDNLIGNLNEALKNVDQASNSLQVIGRNKSMSEQLYLLVKNLIYVMPLFIVPILLFDFFSNPQKFYLNIKNSIKDIDIIFYAPVITFVVWNIFFYKWGLIHGFIFLLLVPFVISIIVTYLDNRNFSKNIKKIIVILICINIIFVFYQWNKRFTSYSDIIKTNPGLERFENIYTKEIK